MYFYNRILGQLNLVKGIINIRSIAAFLVILFGTTVISSKAESPSNSDLRQRLRDRLMHKSSENSQGFPSSLRNRTKPIVASSLISGRQVSVWQSHTSELSPVVIFSHGFRGCSTQSSFIMTAIANAGFTVFAPNHADASCGNKKPDGGKEPGFGHPEKWSEETYKNRRDDIISVLAGLKVDPIWSKKLDFTRVALVGHSLGGYTVLGLAGAWPSWEIPNLKAVIAWSPYSQPFLLQKSVGKIDIPVMFQGGTRDLGITPSIKKNSGAYDQARAPAYFIEFQDAGHFAWTDMNTQQRELISHYSTTFLKRYVNLDLTVDPSVIQVGVSALKTK